MTRANVTVIIGNGNGDWCSGVSEIVQSNGV